MYIYYVAQMKLLLLLLVLLSLPSTTIGDVRKSGSGICHEQGVSPYYSYVGTKSLSEWLPPHHPYRCEYIKQFTLVKRQYRLDYPAAEQRIVNRLKRACGFTL